MNKRPPRLQETRNDFGPFIDRWEPAEATNPGEYKIVAPGRDDLEGGVHIRMHKSRLTATTALSLGCEVSALCNASLEKSSPVTEAAPSRASERVSVPMWHCRWMQSRPVYVAQKGLIEVDDAADKEGSDTNRWTA